MLAVILAGGKSRRMGTDKARLILGDKPILQLLIDRYSKWFEAVAVSVDKPGRFPFYGAMEVADAYPGAGPLAGLHAAILQTGAETLFLTAVDLPNGDPALAEFLESRMERRHDACVILRNGVYEPVFGIFRRSCLEALEASLRAGEFAVVDFLKKLRVRQVGENELAGWDLEHILFNMNYPKDYKKAVDSCLV